MKQNKLEYLDVAVWGSYIILQDKEDVIKWATYDVGEKTAKLFELGEHVKERLIKILGTSMF